LQTAGTGYGDQQKGVSQTLYRLFEGNMSDPASLTHIIKALDEKQGKRACKPAVVMDTGIATEAGLSL
jgi:hypothetical protein